MSYKFASYNTSVKFRVRAHEDTKLDKRGVQIAESGKPLHDYQKYIPDKYAMLFKPQPINLRLALQFEHVFQKISKIPEFFEWYEERQKIAWKFTKKENMYKKILMKIKSKNRIVNYFGKVDTKAKSIPKYHFSKIFPVYGLYLYQ